MDLRSPGEFTDDLFAEVQPCVSNELMRVLDESTDAGAGVPCALRACRQTLTAPYSDEPELYDPSRPVIDSEGSLTGGYLTDLRLNKKGKKHHSNGKLNKNLKDERWLPSFSDAIVKLEI